MGQYNAKDSAVANRELKVQRLVIPITVTANATPASKTQTSDEPGILFINTQGVTGISTSTGALMTGESAPTLATATDSTGVINICARINEPISKIMAVKLHGRGATSLVVSGQVLALSTGTGGGVSVFANLTTGVNLSTTSLDAAVEVEYITTK